MDPKHPAEGRCIYIYILSSAIVVDLHLLSWVKKQYVDGGIIGAGV